MGLTMVLRRLQQQHSHVALHLRHLNPHVASIFQARLVYDARICCIILSGQSCSIAKQCAVGLTMVLRRLHQQHSHVALHLHPYGQQLPGTAAAVALCT